MPVRGIDISNHQSTMDVERVVRDNGIGFVAILTNDGTFRNVHFRAQADAARRGGATVVPYVYLRPNVEQTIGVHLEMSAGFGASIVDVEDGSGGVAEIRKAHEHLWRVGRRTPLLYLPQFYWEKIGRPDVSFLAGRVVGLWKSWYPDNTARGYDAGVDMLPGRVWQQPISGLPVVMVQFTGTGRLPGYNANLDLNYYPGSRQELDAILEGDDMPITDDEMNRIADKAADRVITRMKYEVLAARHDDPNGFLFGGRNLVDHLVETLRQAFVLAGRSEEEAARDTAAAVAITDFEKRVMDQLRSGGVDPEELAALLAPQLRPGITQEQVAEALRGVLAHTTLTPGPAAE